VTLLLEHSAVSQDSYHIVRRSS